MVTFMNDEQIISLFFQRAESAISCIKQKYEPLCRSIARKILADQRDVEECVNDVYLRVWNAIPPERPRSLQAYLARVTRNLALDRYSYNTAAQRASALTDAFEELEPWLPAEDNSDPEKIIDMQGFRQFLNDFLRAQPQDSRIFFLRRYWYGESICEIAKSCHVSEAKVKTSLFRTRNRLRDTMEKERILL